MANAEQERGVHLLKSIRIVVNVIFALMIFQVFLILPRPSDPELKYHTLEQLYSENIMELLVILVGLILVIMYWVQFNKQLANLKRSNAIHASIALLQMFCLMLYLYFVRFDMEYDGLKIALEMESVFLALTGFLGAFNWFYASKNNLTSEVLTKEDKESVFWSTLPEPLASVFTYPFAAISPLAWTLAFLIIIPIGMLIKRIRNKIEIKSLQ